MNDSKLKALLQKVDEALPLLEHGEPPASLVAARNKMARDLAVAAERERWQEVIAFAEPRGQYQLALRLCGNSELPAEELINILMAAPVGGAASDHLGFEAQLARYVRQPGNA